MPALLCRLRTDLDDAPDRRRPVAFVPVDAVLAANGSDVVFTSVAGCRVLGVIVGGEVPLWSIDLEEPVEVPGGATVVIPAGALSVRLVDLEAAGAPAATGGAAGASGIVAPPVGVPLGDGAPGSSQLDTRS